MSNARRSPMACTLWIGVLLAASTTTAAAQGMGRSLGGYGAATIGSYYQDRQGPLIPYSGGFGGYVPYQALEARPPVATMAPRPIRETPIGGTGAMGTPIGGASRRMWQGRIYTPLNLGAGMGGGFGAGRAGGMRAPGFGYPFRRPSSLVGGGGGGGMGSM